MHEELALAPKRRFPRPPSGSEALRVATDVAEWLGVTTAWVYAENRAGHLPNIAVGRSYRYRPSSIKAWPGEQGLRWPTAARTAPARSSRSPAPATAAGARPTAGASRGVPIDVAHGIPGRTKHVDFRAL
jgi:hypothetical protein